MSAPWTVLPVGATPSFYGMQGNGPFHSSFDHLLAELRRIDRLIRIQVWRMRQLHAEDAYRGLAISDEDVEALLTHAVGTPPWSNTPLPPELGIQLEQVVLEQIDLDARIEATREVDLRLARLVRSFGLDPFEKDALLLALTVELDMAYGRLFSWLQDDVTRKYPSVDLVLNLLGGTFEARYGLRSRFLPQSPLRRYALLELFHDPGHHTCPLIQQFMKLDDRIVAYLHGDDSIDIRVRPFLGSKPERSRLADLILPPDMRQRAGQLLQALLDETVTYPILYLQARDGAGKETLAASICFELQKPLLVFDLPQVVARSPEAVETALRLNMREALLRGAALFVKNFDCVRSAEKSVLGAALTAELESFSGLLFISGELPWGAMDGVRGNRVLEVHWDSFNSSERLELWSRALMRLVHATSIPGDSASLASQNGVKSAGSAVPAVAAGTVAESNVDSNAGEEQGQTLISQPAHTSLSAQRNALLLEPLAQRFQFSPGQIFGAVATARDLAAARGPQQSELTGSDLWEACRRHATPQLGILAQKVPTPFTWDDLVMPRDRIDRLREVTNHARYRSVVLENWGFQRKLSTGRGLSMLFAGAPGTGKTMAAGVVARELQLELFQIDLSAVVSKFIGETEKHLARIFEEAERSHAVLFFDEADALFGKRSEVRDAHDRYANIETSYLLQRVDAYDGVVILATNYSRNLDDAFIRRIRFILEFNLPDERERRRLWEQIWPQEVPRDPDLDLSFLAKRFELAGGLIRNIALSSAFLAAAEGVAVAQRHVLHATRRELQKMGKTIDESMFFAKK